MVDEAAYTFRLTYFPCEEPGHVTSDQSISVMSYGQQTLRSAYTSRSPHNRRLTSELSQQRNLMNSQYQLSNSLAIGPAGNSNSRKKFKCFISKYNDEAHTGARLLHTKVEEKFGLGSVFYDTDNLDDIANLPKFITNSNCLVSVLTKSYFTRRYCLIELVHANRLKIPVINVHLVFNPIISTNTERTKTLQDSQNNNNSTSVAFDVRMFDTLLKSAEDGTLLSSEDWNFLRTNGIEKEEIIRTLKLSKRKISLSFYVDASFQVINACTADIAEAILKSIAEKANLLSIANGVFLSYEPSAVDVTRFSAILSKELRGEKLADCRTYERLDFLVDAIKNSKVFVIVVTNEIFSSLRRIIELVTAIENNVKIIPIVPFDDSTKKHVAVKFPAKNVRNTLFNEQDRKILESGGISVSDISRAILALAKIQPLVINFVKLESKDFRFLLAMLLEVIKHSDDFDYKNLVNYSNLSAYVSFNNSLSDHKNFAQGLCDFIRDRKALRYPPQLGRLNTLKLIKLRLAHCSTFLVFMTDQTLFDVWKVLELLYACENDMKLMYVYVEKGFNESKWPNQEINGWGLLDSVSWELVRDEGYSIKNVFSAIGKLRISKHLVLKDFGAKSKRRSDASEMSTDLEKSYAKIVQMIKME